MEKGENKKNQKKKLANDTCCDIIRWRWSVL
jgi:hypothetical protein